jgi:hypothetical protein
LIGTTAYPLYLTRIERALLGIGATAYPLYLTQIELTLLGIGATAYPLYLTLIERALLEFLARQGIEWSSSRSKELLHDFF